MAAAAFALVGVLAFFAISLAAQQRDARQDVEQRFEERAHVAAALSASLFQSSARSSAADLPARYGGPTVPQRTLAQQVRRGQSLYGQILGAGGKVLAQAAGTAAAPPVPAKLPAHIRSALAGKPMLSSLLPARGRTPPALEWALPFKAGDGLRVYVTGIDVKLIADFLGGTLKEVPNVRGGEALIVDAQANVLASSVKSVTAGRPLDDPDLVAAIARGTQGKAGDARRYVAHPVAGSPWRVVLAGSSDELYASVSGAREIVPWAIFVGFALAAFAGLLLLRRTVVTAARLEVANHGLAALNSELAASNELLEERAEALARSNAELDQFASIASHDLQEPLRKVLTFGDRLERQSGERLSEDGHDSLDRMRSAANRMQALIEDLLKFSRVTSQSRPMVPVALDDVAREVIADLDLTVERLGARVDIGELPVVEADALQMRQLLQNLISNALKFHREGVAPVVQIRAEVVRGPQARGAEQAVITVSDNGIGFDDKYADRIFKVFERLHGRGVYDGTGIGLALCRKIAERHGGDVTAHGEPGHGSTFTVVLPVRHAHVPFVADVVGPQQSSDQPEEAVHV